MSCVLRIEGSPDAIESLVESHSFDLLEVEEQSVAIAVSHASMDDFLQQVRDAISFLHARGPALEEARRSIGIEAATLDFAVSRSHSFTQSISLPAPLLLLAGRCNIDIEVSLYPVSDEEAV